MQEMLLGQLRAHPGHEHKFHISQVQLHWGQKHERHEQLFQFALTINPIQDEENLRPYSYAEQ
jgi:hypothetical protein